MGVVSPRVLHATAEARADASSSYEGVLGPSGYLREGLAAGLTGLGSGEGAGNLYSLSEDVRTYRDVEHKLSSHQNVTNRARD